MVWKSSATAIVCHPHPAFGGRLDTPLVLALAQAFERHDVSTIRFNFRGIGGSDGTPTGGLEEAADVQAIAAWAEGQRRGPLILVGYSFGALMIIRAVAQGQACAALAAIGLPTAIIGDHADRIANVTSALSRHIPTLLVQGDRDPFCDVARLLGWAEGHSHITVETRTGEGHFFTQPGSADEVAKRVAQHTTAFLPIL